MPRLRNLAALFLLVLLSAFGVSLGYSFHDSAAAPDKPEPPPAQLTDSAKAPPLPSGPKPQVAANYGRLPLYFIENRGQVNKKVKYYVKGGGQTTFFTKDEVVLALTRPASPKQDESRVGAGLRPAPTICPTEARFRSNRTFLGKPETRNRKLSIVRIKPVGLKKGVTISPLELTGHRVNYFIGNDPQKWRTNIPTYQAVIYESAYAGIDLKFYGQGRQLEYDIVVQPGADPNQVRFAYQGIKKLEVTPEGDLALVLPDGGRLLQKKPLIYQEIAGQRLPVEGKFRLCRTGTQVTCGFALASYDKKQPLVIDPVLVYSTYLGGSGEDAGRSIAVDAAGQTYFTGNTLSTDFPTKNAFQGYSTVQDVFVTKLGADGQGLIYSTYLGGDDLDWANGIAIDRAGQAYVTGFTFSNNFPTQNALQRFLGNFPGVRDAFVTKLSADGQVLIYSTYLGGNEQDWAAGIAVDKAGQAYVTGGTWSSNFPTQNPLQGTISSEDAFVTKFSADGQTLIYSTYLGGYDGDNGWAIATDDTGHAYVTGITRGPFPLLNPFQTFGGGLYDAFVTKISPDGQALIYSTILGGNLEDYGATIAVDESGQAFVAGYSNSGTLPIKNALQTNNRGDYDGFVTKFNADGQNLIFSTYLGGSSDDVILGIGVDANGAVYIAGYTDSNDFPVRQAYQGTKAGAWDSFVTKLSSMGTLVYSTFLGGVNDDFCNDIAVDAAGTAYVVGETVSTNFPTQQAYQGILAGGRDAFITKLSHPLTQPSLGYYFLEHIPSPQTAGVSFPATISARRPDGSLDTGFQGQVYLTCEAGLNLSAVWLTNGVWTGNLAVLEDGQNISPKATGSGREGASNAFSTTAPAAGNLAGWLRDNLDNPLGGGTISLALSSDGPPVYNITTDSDGKYSLPNLPSGEYHLTAAAPGAISPLSRTSDVGPSAIQKLKVYVANRATAIKNIILPLHTSDQTPVILVAGFMGSTKKGHPIPSVDKDYNTLDSLVLVDHPMARVGWDKLKEIFKAKGLKPGQTIIDCPWDWRRPVADCVENYLKKAIERAKGGNPEKKVNIIAHSMGGLIARSYIQSSSQHDVANLSMVGTPHLGSANAYYIWEGGDPMLLDKICRSSTNTLITQGLWNTYNNVVIGAVGGETYEEMEKRKINPLKLKPFLRKEVLSLKQLLPTYPFLFYNYSINSLTHCKNTFLEDLNLTAKDSPLKTTAVTTRMYYSLSENTIGTIRVNPAPGGFYEDGTPVGSPVMTAGDGTVTRNSARFPGEADQGWATLIPVLGEHMSLIQENAQLIADDLYPAPAFRSVQNILATPTSQSIFAISFRGRVQPYLVDPHGRTVGIHDATGEAENSVPNASLEVEAASSSIAIPNPVDGDYTLVVKGRYADAFVLNLEYVDASNVASREFRGYNPAQAVSFTIRLDSGSVEKIIFTPSPAAPAQLQADRAGTATRLTWTASLDPGVTRYRVYARRADETTMQLLGETSDVTYDAADPWAGEDGITPTVYAVVAVKSDGAESFLSNAALNNDRDHDGLTDVEEAQVRQQPGPGRHRRGWV